MIERSASRVAIGAALLACHCGGMFAPEPEAADDGGAPPAKLVDGGSPPDALAARDASPLRDASPPPPDGSPPPACQPGLSVLVQNANGAQNSEYFSNLVIDDTSLYYVDLATQGDVATTGTVTSIPLAGGTPTTLAVSPSWVEPLALGGGILFTFQGYDLVSLPAGGGALTTIATMVPNVAQIIVAGGFVFWTVSATLGSDGAGDTPGQLMSMPVGGGTPSLLHEFDSLGLTAGASSLYWVEDVGVMGMPLSGGPVTTLVSGQQDGVSAFALDDSYFYWSVYGSSIDTQDLHQVPIAGGADKVIASASSFSSIASDAKSVYWTNDKDGTVVGMPVGGGAATTLASGRASPGGLVLDSGCLYWEETPYQAPGQIVSMRK
jgi:hypothetical protein